MRQNNQVILVQKIEKYSSFCLPQSLDTKANGKISLAMC